MLISLGVVATEASQKNRLISRVPFGDLFIIIGDVNIENFSNTPWIKFLINISECKI